MMNIKPVYCNEMDGYSGLFNELINTILSEAKNSNILCMSEVTKYHCIIIHKVLPVCIQDTKICSTNMMIFFPQLLLIMAFN